MQLFSSDKAIKPACHEMPSSTLLEQPGFTDIDATLPGHQVIGILDHSIALRVLQFFVLIAADAVKLVASPVSRLDIFIIVTCYEKMPSEDIYR